MPFFNEINSPDIGAMLCNEVEISIDKGDILSYIRSKPHDKGSKSGKKVIKSYKKRVKSDDKEAKSGNKGVKSCDKGVLSCDKGALSVGKAQKLTDFEVFDNLGKL